MHTALSRLNEEERKEYWACLALRYAHKIGHLSIAKLIKHYGSAYEAVINIDTWAQVGLGTKGETIANDEWRAMAAIEWENARDLDAHIILWSSPYYPEILKQIDEAPSMFYAYGNLELLKNPCMGIVGSRSCTKAGAEIAQYMATALSLCGFTVVSGMARGIDRSAHIGGLKHAAASIGVLGSGIDLAYPSINSDIYINMRNKGLLISEFAPATPPDPRNFPLRNRIISGLSQGVLVIEAGRKSGSTITAYKANDQGRNVYTVPGALGAEKSFGCQDLIRHGAKSVFNVEDILEDIIPLIGAEASEIDELLKAYKLSAEDLFKHKSVLQSDFVEKKLSRKKNDTNNLINEEMPSKIKEKARKSRQKEKGNKEKDNTESNENFSLLYQLVEEEKKEKASKKDNFKYEDYYPKESLEFRVLELVSRGKVHVDTLCQKLGTSAQELTVCLINLEMNDHINRYEGSWYGQYE